MKHFVLKNIYKIGVTMLFFIVAITSQAADGVTIISNPIPGPAFTSQARSFIGFVSNGEVRSLIDNALVSGVWSWNDETTVLDPTIPATGTIDLIATFTPDDTSKYNTIDVTLNVKVYWGEPIKSGNIYVGTNALPSPYYDGSIPARPFRSLAIAVNAVKGTSRKVIVSSGDYYETLTIDSSMNVIGVGDAAFDGNFEKRYNPAKTIIHGNGVMPAIVCNPWTGTDVANLKSMTFSHKDKTLIIDKGVFLTDVYFRNSTSKDAQSVVVVKDGTVLNGLFMDNAATNGSIVEVKAGSLKNPTFVNNKDSVILTVDDGSVYDALFQDNTATNVAKLNGGLLNHATIVINKNTGSAIHFAGGTLLKSIIWNNLNNTYMGNYPAGNINAFQGVDNNNDVINLDAKNDAFTGPQFLDPTAASGKYNWKVRPGSIVIDPQ